MRSYRQHVQVLACLLLLVSAPASQALAQAVNCTGVAPWNPSTIYNPGDRLVHLNQLYSANIQIWNASPTHCPACGWYTLLGTCGGGGNVPPTVSLTAPANGATFPAGSNIALAATAADSDGTIARVEFFQGATSLGVDTTAPYSGTFPSPQAGLYSLTARATDNGGATTTSAAVNITVSGGNNTPPTVALTAPANNSSFPCNTTITVSATAADSDGTIARVEFFDGGTSIGQDTTSPYSVSWSTSVSGAHTLTARATDNGGSSTTSAARTVNITGNCNVTVRQIFAPYVDVMFPDFNAFKIMILVNLNLNFNLYTEDVKSRYDFIRRIDLIDLR